MAKNGLIILGNGADLHFDLKTKWTDYWDWRKRHLLNTAVYEQSNFFDFLFLYLESSQIDDTWSDVEGFLQCWFGNKSSVLGNTIARAVLDLELPSEFRKYIWKQSETNNDLCDEIVSKYLFRQYFIFENLFVEYLLQNRDIAKFYEKNDNYSDLISDIMELNPCDEYDIVDYNYEPLEIMLGNDVLGRIGAIYQPHGTVRGHVIVGGSSPQYEFESYSSQTNLGKWFRAQKLLDISDYNCNWFDYTDIIIYGWSISVADKGYNIAILDTDGINWPQFNSIDVHVLYSTYLDFKFCEFYSETVKRLYDYECGMRNALVKTKQKSTPKYSDFFGSANSFFNLDFKEIL